jgi:hypothetical protein
MNLRRYKMRIDVDIQLDFYCDVCGSPMDNSIFYDNLRSIIRIEPCENCLEVAREAAREEAREEAIKEAHKEATK